MTTQLRLIDGGDRRPWRLDSRTRAIGRRGVALARRWRRSPDDVWAEWAGVGERWPASGGAIGAPVEPQRDGR